MFNIHCYLDGKRTGGFIYQGAPRVGDTIRFSGERYGKVTEVIWCADEPQADGQRVNLRLSVADQELRSSRNIPRKASAMPSERSRSGIAL